MRERPHLFVLLIGGKGLLIGESDNVDFLEKSFPVLGCNDNSAFDGAAVFRHHLGGFLLERTELFKRLVAYGQGNNKDHSASSRATCSTGSRGINRLPSVVPS